MKASGDPVTLFTDDPAALLELAAICDEAASVPLPLPKPTTNSCAARDSRWLASEFQSEEPARWIVAVASTYLAECTLLTRSAASALRSGHFGVTIDLTSRAVVERVGRAMWVLDPDVTARCRAARAGLEFTVSQQHYRRAATQLRATRADLRLMRDEHVRLRELLKHLFAVQQPPGDDAETNSMWTVDGETYPTYEEVAVYADPESSRLAKGTYGGLSGFGHPNVAAAAEHRDYDLEGRITYAYRSADLIREARRIALQRLSGVRYYAAYLTETSPDVDAALSRLAGDLDTLLAGAP